MQVQRSVMLAVGETMAMIAPASVASAVDASDFMVDAGGAESNVASHVAALGLDARWFSHVGDDAFGHRVVRQLGERGVDVSTVVFDRGNPTGIYVKDPGRGVVYYRTGSAAAHLSERDADAVSLFEVDVLHVSGITVALSDSAASFLDRLIGRARMAGVIVSIDVNYRPVLWRTSGAALALDALARRADILFTGRDEAEDLWATSGVDDIRRRFPDVGELVVKDGAIGATVFCGRERVFEPSQRVEVIDLIGAGDAFAGGYLAARMKGASLSDRLLSGHARAALTLGMKGDSTETKGG